MTFPTSHVEKNLDQSQLSQACIVSSSLHFIAGDSGLLSRYKPLIQSIDEKLVTIYYKKCQDLHYAASLIIVTNTERNREERLIFLYEMKDTRTEENFFRSYVSALSRMVSTVPGYGNAKIYPDIFLDSPQLLTFSPVSVNSIPISSVVGNLLFCKKQVISYDSESIHLSRVISIIRGLSPLISIDCDFSFSRYPMKTDFIFTNIIPNEQSSIMFLNNQLEYKKSGKPNYENFYKYIGSILKNTPSHNNSRTQLRNEALGKFFFVPENLEKLQKYDFETVVLILSDILAINNIPSSIVDILPDFLRFIDDIHKINILLELFISKNLVHAFITNKAIISGFTYKNEEILFTFIQSPGFNQSLFCNELHTLLSDSSIFEDIISCIMEMLQNKNDDLLRITLPVLIPCFPNKDEILNRFSFLQKTYVKKLVKETNM